MPIRFKTFDGHNDVALRFYFDAANDPIAKFLDDATAGHINLPAARAGGLAGGFFALFSPSREELDLGALQGVSYDIAMPKPLDPGFAQASAFKQLSMLLQLERAARGQVKICRTVAEIRACMAGGVLAILVHMEGADAIDGDLHLLDIFHAAGLRSLGPVWSRHNIFGHGVPLKFPSGPDTGPGLTEAGKRLVKACNERRILVDLSHITERGFWDVAELTTHPLVATHSNVHAISPVARNLTDAQLKAVRQSRGVVGLNFATAFLRPDGQMRADTRIELMVRHLEYLLEHLGETCVAIGSDFDGAIVPEAIGGAAGLPRLFEALAARGIPDAVIARIASENWMDVLARTIDPD